jgi:hypothetical protein
VKTPSGHRALEWRALNGLIIIAGS